MYGFFAEINPEPTPERRPVKVRVYSGEDEYTPTRRFPVEEKQGQWYAPYLASLITSGGRLLLAMLEKSIVKAGGTHAWADTDSLAIVSSKSGGPLRHIPGCNGIKALSWSTVRKITEKFEALNPYDRSAVPDSILNLVDANFENFDPSSARRQLLGFSMLQSGTRYMNARAPQSRLLIPRLTDWDTCIRPLILRAGMMSMMLRVGFTNSGNIFLA
jgi:hypothetical protein